MEKRRLIRCRRHKAEVRLGDSRPVVKRHCSQDVMEYGN